jgi:hypothetical protein
MSTFNLDVPIKDKVSEHRHSSRKHKVQEVMVRADNDHRLCRVRDLSDRGVLLDLGWGKLTRDVEVEIIIDLPVNNILTPHHIFGEVARVSEIGTAIRFTVINSETQKALLTYLAN